MPRLAPILLALAMLLPGAGADASFINLVAPSPTLLPGQSETITVTFTATEFIVLEEIDLAISYDTTRFRFSNAQPGTLDQDFSASSYDRNGTVTFTFLDIMTLKYLEGGQGGSVATFTLTALADAPTGGSTGDINLLVGTGNFKTAVYDTKGSAYTLAPAPTNGFDPGVDATVVVVAPATAVPGPSSLALCGTAGLGGLGLAWRRRAVAA